MEKHTTLDFYLKKNKRNKIPLFAQLIFMDEDYSDVEKIKFRNQFLNKYLNNSTFRKQVQGYYLYFYNNELFAVYKKQEDLDPNIPGYKTICYKITDTHKKEYLLHYTQPSIEM